jgi:putative transposase
MGHIIRTEAERIRLIEVIQATAKRKQISIRSACLEIGITDSSYYNWLKRLNTGGDPGKPSDETVSEGLKTDLQPAPATKINDEDGQKILEVKAAFPHMGGKQLRQHLIRNYKIIYSFRQIRQFLEANRVPKLKAAYEPKPIRRFERDTANEMWQIDIMSFHVGAEPLHLMSFLDDYSRFIVSYQVADNQSSGEILSLLRRAVSFRKPLSILTDRGIQFCSWNGVTAFQLELRALQIDHLVAREQHPETIGKIEAFHKTIQRELLTTTEFSGIDEAKERIHDYIMFYNFARPHMGIDNLAPAERYFKSLKAYNPHAVYYRKAVPFKRNRHGFKGRQASEEKEKRQRKAEDQTPGTSRQGLGTEGSAPIRYPREHRRRQPYLSCGRRREETVMDHRLSP